MVKKAFSGRVKQLGIGKNNQNFVGNSRFG